MNRLIVFGSAFLVALFSVSAHAQSCANTVAEMAAKSAQGYRTSLTYISYQANGLSSYAGRTFEAYLKWDGSRMSSRATGGHAGSIQFSDRSHGIYGCTPAQAWDCPHVQDFTIYSESMESVDVYLTSSTIQIYNNKWGYWITISNPQCANGVIWGLGTPVGNANGSNRAVYVFSYAYTA